MRVRRAFMFGWVCDTSREGDLFRDGWRPTRRWAINAARKHIRRLRKREERLAAWEEVRILDLPVPETYPIRIVCSICKQDWEPNHLCGATFT